MPRKEKKSKSQKRREKVQQEATEEKKVVPAKDGVVTAPNGDKIVTDKEEVEFSETSGEGEVDVERKDMDEANEAEEEKDEVVSSEEEKKVDEEKEEVKPKKNTSQTNELSTQVASLSGMMSELVTGMTAMARRVERMETGGANEFRYHANPADIAKAATGRVGIDERIIKLVDTILGEDFGIELNRIDDNSLGLMFTVNVPQRLSDIKEDLRPLKDSNTGETLKDEKGRDRAEKYWPGDRRSRAVPTGSSFDLIREHCERVRAYIVATYQKTNRPTPEFRIKN